MVKRYLAKTALWLLAFGWLIPLIFVKSPATMPWWGNPRVHHVHDYPVALTIAVWLAACVVATILFLTLLLLFLKAIEWCWNNR